MEKQVFREKSVERIASPEQLQDYMRVNGHMNRFKATASGNSLRETYTGDQTGKR